MLSIETIRVNARSVDLIETNQGLDWHICTWRLVSSQMLVLKACNAQRRSLALRHRGAKEYPRVQNVHEQYALRQRRLNLQFNENEMNLEEKIAFCDDVAVLQLAVDSLVGSVADAERMRAI